MKTSNHFYATLDITTRCNLKCKHCRTDAVDYELSLDQIKIILEKLKHPRRRIIFISGGEPLIRADIVEIVKLIKNSFSFVGMNTNSLLLTEKLLGELEIAGLDYIQVSIDGLKNTHDYIRGHGTFEKAMKAMEMISNQSKIKIHVCCCVSKLNLHEIESLTSFLVTSKNFKVDLLGFKRFVPKNEMAGKGNLGIDGFKNLLYTVEKMQVDYKDSQTQICVDASQKNVANYDNAIKILNKYNLTCVGCSAATGGPSIRADGTVSPCTLLYVNSGNLLETNLDEIYRSEIYEKLCLRELKGKCATCKYLKVCGGCRAVALAIHGDYLAEDPECFIC